MMDQTVTNGDTGTDGAVKDDSTKEKTPEDPREKLTKKYHNVARRYHQIDGDELLEMYLTALTTSFDPHTSYMSPRRNWRAGSASVRRPQ